MKHRKLQWLCLSAALMLGACSSGTAAASTAASATAMTYQPGTYTASASGMWGPVEVTTTFDESAITDIEVQADLETPGLRDWPVQIIPEEILQYQSLDVDTVTFATFTSNAIINGVADCVEQAGGDPEALKAVAVPAEETQSEYTADVVIVGGGGAGLAAATAAMQAGSSVVLVEKAGFLGGNTMMAGSIYNCADPEMQQKYEMTEGAKSQIEEALAETPVDDLHAEVQALVQEQYDAYLASGETYLFDSPEWHALQTWNGGDKIADLNLDLVLARNALAGKEWLQSMGWELQDKIGQGAGSLYQRTHYEVLPNMTGMIYAFEDQVMNSDLVTIVMETPVSEILMDGDRAVGAVGTAKDGTTVTFHANKAVIITTGGFAGNVEMRQKYCEGEKWPDLGPSLNTTNMPADQGDGIVMAEAVGANLVDMEQIQLLHTTNPVTGTTGDACMPLSTGGAIFVNQDGNRFWREDGRRDDLSKAAMAQNEDAIFWVVESSEAIPDPTTTKTTDGRTVQYMLDNNLSDYVTGDTIEELAANMGVDAENLRAAIEDYNAHVDSQEPDAFGRTLFTTKLATAPYYAFTRAPSAHHTMGGININENAQVLDTDGNVIPGLYAAGEVTGGIHGGNRLGGNATVDVVVFGRIAGTNAAAEE